MLVHTLKPNTALKILPTYPDGRPTEIRLRWGRPSRTGIGPTFGFEAAREDYAIEDLSPPPDVLFSLKTIDMTPTFVVVLRPIGDRTPVVIRSAPQPEGRGAQRLVIEYIPDDYAIAVVLADATPPSRNQPPAVKERRRGEEKNRPDTRPPPARQARLVAPT